MATCPVKESKEWKNLDSRRPRRSNKPRGGASALIIFNIIQERLITQISALSGIKEEMKFLQAFTALSQQEYLKAQAEALKLLTWLKRYARSFEIVEKL